MNEIFEILALVILVPPTAFSVCVLIQCIYDILLHKDKFNWEDWMEEPQGHGNCFEVAGKLISIFSDDAVLCHGKVTGQGPIEGLRIEHAWIEIKGIVIDKSNGSNFILSIEDYYKVGKVNPIEVQKYSPREALQKMLRYRTYGPWGW